MSLFEIIFTLCGLIGTGLIAMHKKVAFIIYSIGNVFGFIMGLQNKLYFFCMLLITYTLFNLYGYNKWGRDEKKTTNI